MRIRSEQVLKLSDGAVQMYIRDPAGNLVELDWPDVNNLDGVGDAEHPSCSRRASPER